MHVLKKKSLTVFRMFSVPNITINKVKHVYKSGKYICPMTELTVLSVNIPTSAWNSYILMRKKTSGPCNDSYPWLHLLAINITHHSSAFASLVTYIIVQFSDCLVYTYSASLSLQCFLEPMNLWTPSIIPCWK